MRTVPAGVITNMTDTRTINARATVRKMLPTFSLKPINGLGHYTGDETVIDDDPHYNHDVVEYSGGIMRIARTQLNGIMYQHVTNISAATWPDWAVGPATNNCSPCLAKGGGTPRLFYRDATSGQIQYADWNGFGWDTPVPVVAWSTSDWVTMSSPAPTILIIEYHTIAGGLGPTNPGKIRAMYIPYTGDYQDWEGRILHESGSTFTRQIDSVLVGDTSVIFWGSDSGKRLMSMTWNGKVFSDVDDILALDELDDYSQFVFGGATSINTRPVVTGVLKRPGGAEMHMYMIGPKAPTDQNYWQLGGKSTTYTLGRNMYIGDSYTSGGTYYSSGDIPPFSGKLNLVGSKLVFAGIGVVYIADATKYFGYDNTSLKTVLTAINDVTVSQDVNASARLALDVGISQAHALIASNNEIELEIGYGGQYVTVGHFGIDIVAEGYDEEGKNISIHGRSRAMRALGDWSADANYDYWSQTKQKTNPGDKTQIVHSTGQWGSGADLTLDELNVDGIAYSVIRPHRGVITKAKFSYPTGLDCKYGFLLNYYKETIEDAATRLGKEEEDVTSGDLTYYAIAVLWGTTLHSGGQGFAVYEITNSVWGTPQTFAHTIPSATDHWLMVNFEEGALRLWYRLNSSSTWTNVNGLMYPPATRLPWIKNYRARTGVFMRNITPYSTSYGFQSDTLYLPVDDNTVFQTPETVIVDAEQIHITGKSNARTKVADLQVVDGYTFSNVSQPHDNAYTGPFVGYEIYCDTEGASQVHDYYDDCSLVVTDGLGRGHAFRIMDYDYTAPHQWIDTGGPYTAPETWTDHVGDLAYGYWSDTNYRRIFVDKNPRGIVNDTSVVSIVQSLVADERGYSSTIATSHPDGQINTYFNGSVACKEIQIYSRDPDFCQEDMIRIVASKAGVLDFSFKKKVSNFSTVFDRSDPSPVFDIPTDIGDFGMVHNGSAQLRFRTTRILAINEEVGVVFNFNNVAAAYSGNVVTFDRDNAVKFYNVETNGTLTLVESVTLTEIIDSNVGWISVSYDKGYISVWAEERLVAGFYGLTDQIGTYKGFVAKMSSSSNYAAYMDWPELCRRVDNFVIDIGRKGAQALSELIGDKYIWYMDDQNGALKAFFERDVVSAQYLDAVSSSVMTSDLNTATRIRAEGVSTAERVDVAKLQTLGNLFRLANVPDLDEAWEVDEEASRILSEAILTYNSYSVSGRFDPRMEAGDIATVSTHSGSFDIIIDGMNFHVKVSEGEAEMDMEVVGHEA